MLTSLLISSAMAGSPSSVEGLAWEIDALQRKVEGVLVVGVEDLDSERLVRRLEREVSGGNVLFIPMRPSSVDANAGHWTVEHVLRVRGQSCGMLVVGGQGGWTTNQVGGDCERGAPVQVAEPAPLTTPGFAVYVANDDAPVADPGYLRAYQRQSLYRGLDYGGPWGIYDGWGESMTTREFARMVDDDFTLQRLRRERVATTLLAAALVGTGVAMVGGSNHFVSPLTDMYMGPFEMESGTFDDRRNRAFVGAAVTTIGLIIPIGITGKQKLPHNYYSGLEADLAIDRYNDTLRDTWSLSEEDVSDLEPLRTLR